MLLNKVTREHLERLKQDKPYNPELFISKTSPRVLNENPNYHSLVVGLSKLLESHFASQSRKFTQEHRFVVNYVGMVCFRILEIAQQQGSYSVESIRFRENQMKDPDLTADTPPVIEAREILSLFLTKHGFGDTKKNT